MKRPDFKPPKRTATVLFDEDSPFHGAEIVMRLNAPLSLVFELQRYNSESTEQDVLIKRLGDSALVSWNIVDDDDQPVPANGEGLLAQPTDFVWGVINAWSEAMTKPGVPLLEVSSAGASSAAG